MRPASWPALSVASPAVRLGWRMRLMHRPHVRDSMYTHIRMSPDRFIEVGVGKFIFSRTSIILRSFSTSTLSTLKRKG